MKMNPFVPTQEHLEYFYKEVLVPTYSDSGKTEEIEIGDGKTIDLPHRGTKKITLGVPEVFRNDGREYRPQQMFLNQNKGMKPLGKKFQKKQVQKRIDKATKMPDLSFSLEPVKLIKPKYGRLPTMLGIYNKGASRQKKDRKLNKFFNS